MGGVELDDEDGHVKTPVKAGFVTSAATGVVTPPPTKEVASSSKGKKIKGKGKNLDVVIESEGKIEATPSKVGGGEIGDPMSVGSELSMASKKSPFESWQRTKSGRKRVGEEEEDVVGAGKGKRVRGGRGAGVAVGSPA